MAAALCLGLLPRTSLADKDYWLVEKLDPAAAGQYANPVIQLERLPDGPTTSFPAVLLEQANERWVWAKLRIADTGDYRISLRRDRPGGVGADLVLHQGRRFENDRFDVALVIDASHSMRRNDPNDLRLHALRQFVRLARESERINSLSLIVFSTETRALLGNIKPSEIEDLDWYLSKLKPRASTDFNAPFEQAAALLEKGSANRKALLFLSDGKPVKQYRETHRLLDKLDCPIYSIGLSAEADVALLGRIAREGGGELFNAPEAEQLPAYFVRIFHLIDQPRSILRQTLRVQAAAQLPFYLDPTMRNPVLKYAVMGGQPSFRLDQQALPRPKAGDVGLTPLPRANGRRVLHVTGQGKVFAEVLAQTDVALETIAVQQRAPQRLPLLGYFFLRAEELCDSVEPTAKVACPDGAVRPAAIRRLPAGLYAVEFDGGGAPGPYQIRIEVGGELEGGPFLRAATLSYERLAAATQVRGVGVLEPGAELADEPLTGRGRLDVGAKPGEIDRSSALRTTFWASTPALSFTGLYPGEPAERQVEIILGGPPGAGSASVALNGFDAGKFDGRVEGALELNRRSKLSVFLRPGMDLAGVRAAGDLQVKAGGGQWRVPITAVVRVPEIGVQTTAPRLEEADGRFLATSWIDVSLRPRGRVQLRLQSDVAGLEIEPDSLTAGSEPARVMLRLVGERPPRPGRWAGVIRIGGPGLAPVEIPYQFEIAAEEPEPEIKAASPAAPSSFPYLWHLFLILFLLLLLASVAAAIKGHKRGLFLLTSVAVHILIFLIVLPRTSTKEETANAVTTLMLPGAPVSYESEVKSETAAYKNAELEAEQPADQAKEEAPAEAAEVEEPRDLQTPAAEAAKVDAEERNPVEHLEREKLAVREVEDERPAPERKRTDGEPTEASEQASQDTRELVMQLRLGSVTAEPEVEIEELRQNQEQPESRRPEFETAREQLATQSLEAQLQAAEAKRAELQEDAGEALESAEAKPAESQAESSDAPTGQALAPEAAAAPAEATESREATAEVGREELAMSPLAPAAAPGAKKHSPAAPGDAASHTPGADQLAERQATLAETARAGLAPQQPNSPTATAAAKPAPELMRPAVPAQPLAATPSSLPRKQAASPTDAAAKQALAGQEARLESAAAPTSAPATPAMTSSALAPMRASAATAAEGREALEPVERDSMGAKTILLPDQSQSKRAASEMPGKEAEEEVATTAKAAAKAAKLADAAAAALALDPAQRERERPATRETRPELQRQDLAIHTFAGEASKAPARKAALADNAPPAPEVVARTGLESPASDAQRSAPRLDRLAPLAASAPSATATGRENVEAVAAWEAQLSSIEGRSQAVSGKKHSTSARGTTEHLPGANQQASHETAATDIAVAALAPAAHAAPLPAPTAGNPLAALTRPGRTVPALAPAPSAQQARKRTVGGPRGAARELAASSGIAESAGPTPSDSGPSGRVVGVAVKLGTGRAGPSSPVAAANPTQRPSVSTAEIAPSAGQPAAKAAATVAAPGRAAAWREGVAVVERSAAKSIAAKAGSGPLSPAAARAEREAANGTAPRLAVAPGPERQGADLANAATPVHRRAASSAGRQAAGAAIAASPGRASETPAALPEGAADAKFDVEPVQTSALAAAEIKRGPPGVEIVSRVAASGKGPWRNTLPLVRYSGDWDCDRTAMINLAHRLEARTGSTLPINSRTIDMSSPELGEAPFIFMTGHKDFTFARAELTGLKRYLAGGGYLWLNDSTDIGDDAFDGAVRREFQRAFPGLGWRRIPRRSNLFRGPYDLTKGYLGYAVPPGDKYRQDYLEGLWIKDRLAVIYTRNDYGDGLEINPLTHPLMASLSDLSPQEMQEGATRMGINIVMFFLNRGGAPPVRLTRRVRAEARAERRAPWEGRPRGPFALFGEDVEWRIPEGWEDALDAELAWDKKRTKMTISFQAAGRRAALRRDKAVVKGDATWRLTRNQVLLVDVHSGLRGGARLALAFQNDEDELYLESAPKFVRPGQNRDIAFDLRQETFKSAASKWEYKAPFPDGATVTHWYFILYPQQPRGQLSISRPRTVVP